MTHQGLKVGEARVRVTTNAPALLEPRRFFWMDTNFLGVERIPADDAEDSFLEIWDGGTGPVMEIEDRTLILRGGFSRLEETARDLRYSIFGNLGIFSAWVLRTMEQEHAVHTFHACGLVKENTLLIIPGGAGAGKSVFLFAALERGWRLFSTEFIHFRSGTGTVFFKGSLKDAVRLDTFREFFPDWPARLGVDLKAEAGGKLVVDLSGYQTEMDDLEDPEVALVFPHVEEFRPRILCGEMSNREDLRRALFTSATEKLDKSLLLYGRLAVPGLDTLDLAEQRVADIDRLLDGGRIRVALTWVSGVRDTHKVFDQL